MRRGIAGGLGAALVLAGNGAWATDLYEVPAPCADVATFDGMLHQDAVPAHRVASVRVAKRVGAGPKLMGEIGVRTRSEIVRRSLEATSCDDLLKALSLAASVALEADDAAPLDISAVPVNPPALQPEPPTPGTPSPSLPALRFEPASRPPVGLRAPDVTIFATSALGAPTVGLGVSGAFGPGQWSLRPGISAVRRTVTLSPSESVRFDRIAARVDGCLRAIGGLERHVEACIRAEAGVLRGSPTGVELGVATARPWLAAGPALLARWGFAEHVFALFETAATAIATRDEFVLRPQREVMRPAAVAVTAGLGLGVTIP